jgi:hypothetical protein
MLPKSISRSKDARHNASNFRYIFLISQEMIVLESNIHEKKKKKKQFKKKFELDCFALS